MNPQGWTIGDDWISVSLPDLAAVHLAFRSVQGKPPWLETIPGLDSLAVQFNPSTHSTDEAASILQQQLEELERSEEVAKSATTIPICFAPEMGPDQQFVAEHVGIGVDDLPDWFASLHFSVSMLGFMPGFAYLHCSESVPEIGRLAQPRQKVIAGSVGIIGDQGCIYSFDSPGGWPIVGRTPLRLYDNADPQPALLSPGQEISFEAVGPKMFQALESNERKWP